MIISWNITIFLRIPLLTCSGMKVHTGFVSFSTLNQTISKVHEGSLFSHFLRFTLVAGKACDGPCKQVTVSAGSLTARRWSLKLECSCRDSYHVQSSPKFRVVYAASCGKQSMAELVRRASEGRCSQKFPGIETARACLSGLAWNGLELLASPLLPNFWRPTTDNDYGPRA